MILNDAPKIICTGPSVEDHFLFDEETGLRLPFTLNGTFSMFETRSITEDEIKNAENYPTISLTLDSKMWYPEDESFKLNKDSNFYNRGDMFLPTIAIENTPVADEYLSAAVDDFGWN